MLPAINFNHEPDRSRYEITNERAYRNLPIKPNAS
jgi:hypothetical protein